MVADRLYFITMPLHGVDCCKTPAARRNFGSIRQSRRKRSRAAFTCVHCQNYNLASAKYYLGVARDRACIHTHTRAFLVFPVFLPQTRPGQAALRRWPTRCLWQQCCWAASWCHRVLTGTSSRNPQSQQPALTPPSWNPAMSSGSTPPRDPSTLTQHRWAGATASTGAVPHMHRPRACFALICDNCSLGLRNADPHCNQPTVSTLSSACDKTKPPLRNAPPVPTQVQQQGAFRG